MSEFKTYKATSDIAEIFKFLTGLLEDFFKKENLPYRAKFLVATHIEFPDTSNIGHVAKQKEGDDEVLKYLIVFKPPFAYGIGIYKVLKVSENEKKQE